MMDGTSDRETSIFLALDEADTENFIALGTVGLGRFEGPLNLSNVHVKWIAST